MPAKKLRDLKLYAGGGIEQPQELYAEFKALLMKNVKIPGLGFEEEEFFLNEIIDTNQVGYDKLLGVFSRVAASGELNIYYNPTRATFINPQRSYERRISYSDIPAGAYIIKGLPAGTSWYNILMRRSLRIAATDSSIYQNLQAVKTPFIAVCRDENVRLSILTAVQQRQDGDPVIVSSPEVGEALKGVQTYTEYLVDRLNEYKQSERAAALNAISIVTANTDKRERVQVGEVNAKIGECEDYIYTFIDNVNKQFKTFGIPYHMELSASLQNYLNDYTQGEEDDSDPATEIPEEI